MAAEAMGEVRTRERAIVGVKQRPEECQHSKRNREEGKKGWSER